MTRFYNFLFYLNLVEELKESIKNLIKAFDFYRHGKIQNESYSELRRRQRQICVIKNRAFAINLNFLIPISLNSVGLNNLSLKYLRFTPSVCKGIEIRKSEILTRTHFISLQTMIYVSNYQICYSNVFLKQIIQNKFVFGLDYWLDPEQLALKTIGFGGIQTQGTKQFGSEEYKL